MSAPSVGVRRSPTSGFNEAGASSPRMNLLTAGHASTWGDCFNEAGASSPRMKSCHHPGLCREHRFNEAGASSPRMIHSALKYRARSILLQ